MEPQLREFLISYYTGYLVKRAEEYLNQYHYDKYTFADDKKSEYRSPEEKGQIDNQIESQAEEKSKEIVDELDIRGLDLALNAQEIDTLIRSVLKDFYKRIDELISELP